MDDNWQIVISKILQNLHSYFYGMKTETLYNNHGDNFTDIAAYIAHRRNRNWLLLRAMKNLLDLRDK